MNGIENAQWDISDARACLETAMELLANIGQDGEYDAAELKQVVGALRSIQDNLNDSYERLNRVLEKAEPQPSDAVAHGR